MRGRKPTPTKIKILNGNPGKRPLNKNEPKPDPAIPDAPDHLSAEARKEWERLVVELGKVNLLTQLDRGTLAAYCQCWGRWVMAERMVAKLGTMLRSKLTGQLYPNPYLHVASRALDQLTRLGQLLGLDPSSRTRLDVQPPVTDDEMERFLNPMAGLPETGIPMKPDATRFEIAAALQDMQRLAADFNTATLRVELTMFTAKQRAGLLEIVTSFNTMLLNMTAIFAAAVEKKAKKPPRSKKRTR